MTTRRPAEPSATHDRWLVSYADFVTLLFALFVVLFASAHHDNQQLKQLSQSIHAGFNSLGAHPPEAGNKATPAEHSAPAQPPESDAKVADMTLLNSQLSSALGDSIAKQQIVLQRNHDGLVISLRELGFFGSGNADLLPGAKDSLQSIAAILSQYPFEVRVEGHSDDQPIHNVTFHSNWELSTARATSVLLLLVNASGLDPAKVSLAGYGPYRPIAGNDTPEGRRMNRRVDLVVLNSSF